MFKETLLGLLNHVKRLSIKSNMDYVTSTPCQPNDPIRPHKKPIKGRTLNSFAASLLIKFEFSLLGRGAKILLLGRSAKCMVGKVYCRKDKVNTSLGEAKESRKIEILVVVPLYFLLSIRKIEFFQVRQLSDAVTCCKLLHS